MTGQRINGAALGAMAAGSVFLFAGIKGYSIPATIQDIVSGKNPKNQAQANAITGGTLTSSTGVSGANVLSGSDAQNRALGKTMAAARGWTGAQWTALDTLWGTYESGWSSTVANPGSGAAGIAQNISGFGPGYEKGNAGQQITWGLDYIAGRYQNPVNALAFELSHNPHWY
jgi:resuscitation-promoting factor RpfB